jgi:hypothetical protein
MTPEYKFCDDGKVILKNPEMLSQRTWVGLTDEEINKIRFDWMFFEERAKAIEAKLKEKNT